jgi:cytochrome c5
MSASEKHPRESLIKTPKQLVIVLVLALVVPVYMANAAGGKFREPAAPAPAAQAAAGEADGKKVYESTCMACHGAGVANAPKFGDKKAWAMHLMHGTEHVYENALKGKGAMPPKGGNLTLSDAEVKAAVDYMLGAVK